MAFTEIAHHQKVGYQLLLSLILGPGNEARANTCSKLLCYYLTRQGGVTPIDSITAATALVNPYTKEGVELLRILPYTSVNVRVVNGYWLKFNAVKGQSPKISMVNNQNAEKSWSKF